MSIDLLYCDNCKSNTSQVEETTGYRCQKCFHQNPFDNIDGSPREKQSELIEYLIDLIKENDMAGIDDLMNYYKKKREEIRKFIDSLTQKKEANG